MVAQNVDDQRRRLSSVGITGRPSFSHRDLDYKMKMLQLTLVYRRSVAEDRPPSIAKPNRHSIAQETFAKVKPLAIGQPFHRPKVLAVEPKLKKDADQKQGKPLDNTTSATLPLKPQQSKVHRLVQMFETNANTVPKKPFRSLIKPPQKHFIKPSFELKTHQQSSPIMKKENSTPNDDEIRADLKQRKQLDFS